MPTADSFTALGMGNGFPFCHTSITQRDISNSFYSNYKWTTLSGVNSDNYNSFDDATLSQKVDSSRDMAMRLYWNKFMSNGMIASSSGSFERKGSFGIYYDWDWDNSLTISSGDVDVPEPSNRICTQLDGYTLKRDTVGPHNFKPYLLDYKAKLYAFYDSDKFLGYGAELGRVSSVLDPFSGYQWCACRIRYEAIRSPEIDLNTSNHKRSTDFSTISGMHFVRFREGEIFNFSNPSGSPSITLNANSVQASLSRDRYENENDYAYINFECSASGPTSIDFYTY